MTDVLQKFNPNDLIRIAVDQNADLDKLEKLMDLQLRWEINEAKKAFTAAMAAFKAECPKMLSRDGEVDYVNKKGQRVHYKHPTLGGISEVVTPILSKHGLSVTFDSLQSKDGITISCEVTHIGGHSVKRSLTAPPDNSGSKNAIQAICSTATYLSRYTEILALGLATEYVNDDDGQSATSSHEPPQERSNQPQEQRQRQPSEQSHNQQRVQRVVAEFAAKFAVIRSDIEQFLSNEYNEPLPVSQWKDEDFERLTVLHRELCMVPAGPARVKAVRERFGLPSSAVNG